MSQRNGKRIVLNISGMSCINCVRAIEKSLSNLNGVISAKVNLTTEKAVIDFDPTILDQKTIEKTIVDTGYQVIHDQLSLQIGGMTCINCAKSIEKALRIKEGIYEAIVNFAAEKVNVEYNSEQISVAGIKKVIQDVGYEVIEPKQGISEDAESLARKRHIRQIKLLLAASITLTIPIMILMWFPPLPMEQNNFVMFLLATPVQFIVGWTFYVGA
ncbi:MAG: copper ion binding protein, partial [Candidatus Bathyarchaeota archaeon]|nr:copper ion binding protein [Candidatus Bathyarchaeota archaeon]